MVFLNYYYYECFFWVNFDLSSCIDEMICWVPYIFVVYFGYFVVFVCIQRYCVRSSTKITPFSERWFALKVWVFLVDVQNFGDFFG